MSDVIKMLPDKVANQIAAGEVIQRPASVVKELLENAVDAGAEKVQLIIKDAGKTLVQVIDDGSGMSVTDARLCFEKHATSKIKDVNDLFDIRTKGFRGEAMPSIAAVAQVELKTKQENENVGTAIKIEGSEILSQEPTSCAKGTNILVKNLFFNIPARRNFLKSNPVETRHIVEEFQRISLTHPEVEFTLHHNDKEAFHLTKGNLRQRITSLFGKNYNERLVPINEETSILRLNGFIGKPEFARKTRGEQYFFVNNRFIKSNYFNHAIFTAYDELIQNGMYPSYFIYMEVDPTTIDVNIHPTKTEVKFEDERAIYSILKSATMQSLGRYNIAPTLDFEKETSFDINPPTQGTVIKAPVFKPDPNYNPFKEDSGKSFSDGSFTQTKIEQEDIASLEEMYQKIDEEIPTEESSQLMEQKEEKAPYQLHGRYIVNHIKSGFLMIDQQRAHERILFEQYIVNIATNQSGSQQLLFPITLEMSQQDIEMLQSVSSQLNGIGFDISEFGKGTIIINGIPATLAQIRIQVAIDEILQNLKDTGEANLKLEEKLARSLAKSASIKPGVKLEQEEMKAIIDQLFACEVPYYTPNGKATVITVPLEEIEAKFS